jgi:Trk K+ transport system NAD-binding subunit
VYPVKVRDQILFANGNWGIVYTGIDKYSSWEQKSLADLDLRKKNLLVLAVEHEGQWSPFPKGSEVLLPDDQILLFGAMSSYRELNR